MFLHNFLAEFVVVWLLAFEESTDIALKMLVYLSAKLELFSLNHLKRFNSFRETFPIINVNSFATRY